MRVYGVIPNPAKPDSRWGFTKPGNLIQCRELEEACGGGTNRVASGFRRRRASAHSADEQGRSAGPAAPGVSRHL